MTFESSTQTFCCWWWRKSKNETTLSDLLQTDVCCFLRRETTLKAMTETHGIDKSQWTCSVPSLLHTCTWTDVPISDKEGGTFPHLGHNHHNRLFSIGKRGNAVLVVSDALALFLMSVLSTFVDVTNHWTLLLRNYKAALWWHERSACPHQKTKHGCTSAYTWDANPQLQTVLTRVCGSQR